jgi:hypothetical protein
MNSIIRFVKRHPLATFFGLAYAFSWSTYFILGTPFLFPDGPFIAALIMASVTRGRGGLKEWLSRCLRWRVGLQMVCCRAAHPGGDPIGHCRAEHAARRGG